MTMGHQRAAGVGDLLDGGIPLQTAEGTAVRLGDYFGEILVIQCLRYYG